jgi:hypothetical protein
MGPKLHVGGGPEQASKHPKLRRLIARGMNVKEKVMDKDRGR